MHVYARKVSWSALSIQYVFFFQVPILPEMLVRLDDYEMIQRSMLGKKMGVRNRDHLTQEDVRRQHAVKELEMRNQCGKL